jgi:uncharacterized protein
MATLPPLAGIGYKPQHFSDLMQDPGLVKWLEVHAENYLGEGGRPLAQLRSLAERFPISVHGVGLSIGGEANLDVGHLARLKSLCDGLSPASFSEHLAWSTHEGTYFNDLLPLPYTKTTLDRIVSHVGQVQDALGRSMLLENPSSYLTFPETEMSEVDFLQEVARQSGCGLLLDVNNVFVSAHNLGFEPSGYLSDFPMEFVGEIHLGGHAKERDSDGIPVLIDDHGHPVADRVWALYAQLIATAGPRPTLIEWDHDVPAWAVLAAEAARASKLLGHLE